MHLLPASHGRGFYKHDAPVDFHIDYGMVDIPNADDVRMIHTLAGREVVSNKV